MTDTDARSQLARMLGINKDRVAAALPESEARDLFNTLAPGKIKAGGIWAASLLLLGVLTFAGLADDAHENIEFGAAVAVVIAGLARVFPSDNACAEARKKILSASPPARTLAP